jgi:hypothetical protein
MWVEAGELDEILRAADRLLVLYVDSRSRGFAPLFDAATLEASVPVVAVELTRAALAGRRVQVTPTVAYFEHGEELERWDGADVEGLERFLDDVEALQERWRVRHGRLQLDRYG